MATHSGISAWRIDRKSVVEGKSVGLVGFPGGAEVKASTCNVRDLGLIPGSGRSPGEGNGNPLQYYCLENPGQRSLVGYSPWVRKESDTTERLHFHFLGLCLSKLLGFSFLNCKVRVLLRLGVRTH